MLTKKQTELIEKMGIHFERGMQPAAARILALLIVSDQEAMSFDEIRQVLMLSKSATSNGVNFLLSTRKIDYITRSGDRKRYFTWSPHNTIIHFKEGIEKILGVGKLLEETLKIKQNDGSSNYKSLAELIDLMNFLQSELPIVFAKWEESKTRKAVYNE
jgi:DNA-binding transcriptional regulator GbsR (MarR family)